MDQDYLQLFGRVLYTEPDVQNENVIYPREMTFTLVKVPHLFVWISILYPLTFPPPLKLSLRNQGKGEKNNCRKGKALLVFKCGLCHSLWQLNRCLIHGQQPLLVCRSFTSFENHLLALLLMCGDCTDSYSSYLSIMFFDQSPPLVFWLVLMQS